MVSKLQVEQGSIGEEAGAHLKRIQSLINSAARTSVACQEEQTAIIKALEVEVSGRVFVL
jgi:hypothetical protein